MGYNISVEGTKMIIEVDLSAKGEPSKSGKSIIIASTRGNKKIQTPAGEVLVGLNVYRSV
jgi:hypothetical protein